MRISDWSSDVCSSDLVQLPERYGIELLDLIDDEWAAYDLLSGFRTSLLWRRQNAFSSRTVELLDEYADRLEDELWLDTNDRNCDRDHYCIQSRLSGHDRKRVVQGKSV